MGMWSCCTPEPYNHYSHCRCWFWWQSTMYRVQEHFCFMIGWDDDIALFCSNVYVHYKALHSPAQWLYTPITSLTYFNRYTHCVLTFVATRTLVVGTGNRLTTACMTAFASSTTLPARELIFWLRDFDGIGGCEAQSCVGMPGCCPCLLAHTSSTSSASCLFPLTLASLSKSSTSGLSSAKRNTWTHTNLIFVIPTAAIYWHLGKKSSIW